MVCIKDQSKRMRVLEFAPAYSHMGNKDVSAEDGREPLTVISYQRAGTDGEKFLSILDL